jgi:hypothetical protein
VEVEAAAGGVGQRRVAWMVLRRVLEVDLAYAEKGAHAPPAAKFAYIYIYIYISIKQEKIKKQLPAPLYV